MPTCQDVPDTTQSKAPDLSVVESSKSLTFRNLQSENSRQNPPHWISSSSSNP